jgi:hypothetical protein
MIVPIGDALIYKSKSQEITIGVKADGFDKILSQLKEAAGYAEKINKSISSCV